MNIRYIRTRSLTWWTGVLAIALGLLQATGLPLAHDATAGLVGTLSLVLSSLLGDPTSSAPAPLIILGLSVIGIRDKMERDSGYGGEW